jgi:hypothetical protein
LTEPVWGLHVGDVIRVVVFLLISISLLGCDALASKEDGVMCEAATTLATAQDLTQKASVKDESGDTDRAREIAAMAKSTADQAYDRLQAIAENVQRNATWQALQSAYTHIAHGANALLPGFANTHGITTDELAAATRELQIAGMKLPQRCFVVRLSVNAHLAALTQTEGSS